MFYNVAMYVKGGGFVKVLFVINPCSGKGKIKNELLSILRIFCSQGYNVTTYVTSARGEAIKAAEEAELQGYECIICCGGDGTLNEVITGVMKSGSTIPVAYIPAGTTNDFAKTHKIPVKMTTAAKAITKTAEKYKLDVGSFNNERYFSYIASFGIFTSASYKTNQNVKNTIGHMAYIFEGISNLINIEEFDISYTADDKEFSGKYIYGGITNSTSVGGVFKYDPQLVDVSDGLFEILMIKKPKNPNDVMKIIGGVTSGDFSDSEIFDFCKASKITLNMPENVTWTLDGEAVEGSAVTVIENVHGKINFLK